MKLKQHISCDGKCKFDSRTCNSNKKRNNGHVNGNVKIIVSTRKSILGILAHVFVRKASI